MLKLDKKQKISKTTSLKYLYEIAAISKELREEYLQKLLKRKNSARQKNTQLLKIIYQYLSEDKMVEWDEESICRILNISKNMLHCHKARLLRGLRMHYFKWNEIEKTEFSDKYKYKDKVELEFAKAKKMFEIEMLREAKYKFSALEIRLTSKNRLSVNERLILYHINYYLSRYYYFQLNLIKFNHHHNNLLKLKNNLLKNNSINENLNLKSEILIEQYYTDSCKSLFNIKNNNRVFDTIENLKLVFREAKKIKNLKFQLHSLINIIRLYADINKTDMMLKYINKGMNLSQAAQMKAENLAFKSFLIFYNYLSQKKSVCSNKYSVNINFNDPENVFLLKKYYEDAKNLNADGFIKRIILYTGMRTAVNKNYYFSYEYTAICIISFGFNFAFRNLYDLKFNYYFDNLILPSIVKDSKTGKQYLSVESIYSIYKNKISNALNELLISHNRIKNVFFKHSVYIYMLNFEFWKGKELNFQNAQYVLKQIDWIDKTRDNIFINQKEGLEILRFGLKIIEDSKYLNKKDFLDNYEQNFKKLSKSFLTRDTEYILDHYIELSYIAEQTQYEELKTIVKNLYWQLEEKYPNLFDSIKKGIKEKELKISQKQNQTEFITFQAA